MNERDLLTATDRIMRSHELRQRRRATPPPPPRIRSRRVANNSGVVRPPGPEAELRAADRRTILGAANPFDDLPSDYAPPCFNDDSCMGSRGVTVRELLRTLPTRR